ncbi:helix-turn-helix domain-containing protein [Chitinophaga sp. sic0106]|uniref:helix-turn-helix domain-containing protein n=1 Tax=Chitinophaga sp. sic0106 TaxID=2854785 RepID=UPI001C45460E|nr:helix-turn-helix domain-containing protein [Chitinophaga sp. sic0106]MBV7529838.1 helix-turn-helix domain-containing protein [Chitinophaga sp. sic0106]
MKKKKNSNLTTLEDFVEKHHGKHGSKSREEFEAGYEIFKLGTMIHDARVAKGLTQEELGAKVGKNKSYISKIENDVKEIRLSTLQKIVEIGLGGRVHLSIEL